MESQLVTPLIPGYDPFETAGDCWFDEEAARLACDFFPECLRHIEGAQAGQPFILQPWQQAIVGSLFGWKRPDGTRRYRETLIYVPRKNGKTCLVAAIAVYVLFCDDEVGQQNLIAAGDLQQATLLFRQAAGMIRQEPELRRRCEIFGERGTSNVRTIMIPEMNSYLRVISADADTKHGGNLHLGIIDELHVQKSRDLVDVLQTSMASANRRQPLLIHITTADFYRESICNEKYEYACKVRDGVIDDPSFLPVIYEAPADADWTSEDVWKVANPNLGVSVSLDYLRREKIRAVTTASFESTFKRLYLNMRTQSDVAWLSLEDWEACGDVQFDESELKDRVCYGGLDLSSTTDLSAFVLVFPEEDGSVKAICRFWVPAVNAEKRERQDRAPYLTWSKQGALTMTETNEGFSIDHAAIRTEINRLGEQFQIAAIAVDRWNATQLINDLSGDGFTMIPWGQGYASMSAPAKEFERLVISHKFHHGRHPVLKWMMSNVMIEEDAAGNIKPSKKKSTERIDGIVAAVMAVGASMENKANGPLTYYENNDLEFV